jgi:hypothetical protein
MRRSSLCELWPTLKRVSGLLSHHLNKFSRFVPCLVVRFASLFLHLLPVRARACPQPTSRDGAHGVLLVGEERRRRRREIGAHGDVAGRTGQPRRAYRPRCCACFFPLLPHPFFWITNIHVVSKYINRDYSSKTKSFILC